MRPELKVVVPAAEDGAARHRHAAAPDDSPVSVIIRSPEDSSPQQQHRHSHHHHHLNQHRDPNYQHRGRSIPVSVASIAGRPFRRFRAHGPGGASRSKQRRPRHGALDLEDGPSGGADRGGGGGSSSSSSSTGTGPDDDDGGAHAGSDEKGEGRRRMRGPYHRYVHRLVQAGWVNLVELDNYLSLPDGGGGRPPPPPPPSRRRTRSFRPEPVDNLTVSVVDLTPDLQLHRHRDLHSPAQLTSFIDDSARPGGAADVAADVANADADASDVAAAAAARPLIRLYLAEQAGPAAPDLIEALGKGLHLDPRFFQWNLRGSRRLISPAERHRAPFQSLSFTVLAPSVVDSAAGSTGSAGSTGGIDRSGATSRTDTTSFRVSLYVKPAEAVGDSSWTGIVLFRSHVALDFFANTFSPPPAFVSNMSLDDYVPLPTQLATTFGSAATPPPPAPPPLSLPSPSPGSGNGPRSVRELFIAYLPFLSLNEAVSSPFYTFQFLFKLNCYTWNQVILAIREEDLQVGGISEYSVNHAEDIRRSADMVRRGGSWSWQRSDSPMEKEALLRLQEDYESTIKQAADLWEARKKMAEIRRRRVDSRVTALTNAFTFFFVPLSLVSSVFGMNVSQISGSTQNPNIWYFFVVVIALNIGIVGALGMSNWFQMLLHRRRHPERYQALSRKPKFTDAFANALGMGDGGPR